jgi:hypothetical protein
VIESSKRSDMKFQAIHWLVIWIIFAFVLRVWGIHTQSLTVDEVGEFDIAKTSFATIWNYPNSFPPLYHVVAKGLLTVANHPVTLRWLSLICGVGSLAVTWKLVCENMNPRAANAIAFMLTVSPFHIYYSQEGRTYAFYMLTISVGSWASLRLLRQETRATWAVFLLTSLLGMLTHYYYAIFLLLAGGVFVAARGRHAFRSENLLWGLGLCIACLPAMTLVKGDLRFQRILREPRPLDAYAFAYTYFSMFTGYSLGPSQSELHEIAPAEAARQASPWALALAPAVIVLAVNGWRNLTVAARWVTMAFTFGPVIVIGLLGYLSGITYNVRFILWCCLPLLFWLSAGFANRRRFATNLALAVLLAVQVIAIFNRHFDSRYFNEDISSLTCYLRENGNAEMPVLVCSDYMMRPIDFYLGSEWTLVPVLAPDQGRDSCVGAKPIQEVSLESKFYLVYVRAFHGDPNKTLLRYLKASCSLEPLATFPGIRLYQAQGLSNRETANTAALE